MRTVPKYIEQPNYLLGQDMTMYLNKLNNRTFKGILLNTHLQHDVQELFHGRQLEDLRIYLTIFNYILTSLPDIVIHGRQLTL